MASDLRHIHNSIHRARSVIDGIRKISGAPGLTVAVIHHGITIHEDYFGYRDVHSQLPVNGNTIFHVASLTKAITAAAVGILVDRGDLRWETPVDEILPFNKTTCPEKSKLSVIDFLSHRTGTTWADALYLQSNNAILLPKEESLRTFEYLPVVASPRTRFLYNNHAYNIPGLLIEAVSKQSYGDFVKQSIFRPLGMSRTYTRQPDDTNVAIPYNILRDGTPFRIPFSEASDSTMMFSGISVRTTVSDLLRLYHAFLVALRPLVPGGLSLSTSKSRGLATLSQKLSDVLFGHGCSSSLRDITCTMNEPTACPSVIKQTAQLCCPRIARNTESLFEQTHSLGWNRTQLPGKLDFGWNSSMVKSMPLFGGKFPGKLAIWHGGNMPGTTAAVILLPETQTAVIVLQNSLGLCDAADLTAQLLVDCIFAGKPQNDYAALASEAAMNGAERMEKVAARLEEERERGTTHRPLHDYVGMYENSIQNWTIEIGIDVDCQLFLRFQKRTDEQYVLRHYHHDVFVWNLTYDEMVKRAQYCRPHAFYRIHFEAADCGSVTRLRWHHDPNVAEGEVFTKRNA